MADRLPADQRLRTLYREARAGKTRGVHVDEEMWVRLADGTLPADQRAAAFDHIVRCDECRRVWRGVSAFDERARAAGLAPPAAAKAPRIATAWLALAATLLLVVGGYALYQSRGVDVRQPSLVSTPGGGVPDAPPSPAPEWLSAFAISKADVHVLPEDALGVRRGAGSGDAPVEALAKALEPYRNDDYPAAVRELSGLAAAYPEADRPNLYLGVSQLFMNRPDQAIAPLQIAARSSVPVIAADARWYLAIAFARTGQPDRARPEVEALCEGGSAHAARACAARDALNRRSR